MEKVFPNGYIDLPVSIPKSTAIYTLLTIPKDNTSILSKVENVINMELAMNSEYSLSQYNAVHEHGLKLPKEIRLAMLKAIDYTLSFFSDSVHKMNVNQAMSLINIILKDFYYFKLEEVILVLRNGKLGHYGKIYNRVDADIVYSWFKQYEEERFKAVEMSRHNENTDFKKDRTTMSEQKIMEEYQKAKTLKLNEKN
jgi:hypothetical protein